RSRATSAPARGAARPPGTPALLWKAHSSPLAVLLSPLDARRGGWHVALGDRVRLLGVGIGDRAVREDVRCHRGVDRRRQVGVDQRHLLAVRQLLALLRLELILVQPFFLYFVGHLVTSCEIRLTPRSTALLNDSISASCR